LYLPFYNSENLRITQEKGFLNKIGFSFDFCNFRADRSEH
jgi:hypothetical protein